MQVRKTIKNIYQISLVGRSSISVNNPELTAQELELEDALLEVVNNFKNKYKTSTVKFIVYEAK